MMEPRKIVSFKVVGVNLSWERHILPRFLLASFVRHDRLIIAQNGGHEGGETEGSHMK